MKTQKNYLVTGGFGFIGGHLIEQLLKEKGSTVHVVDDLSSSPVSLESLLNEIANKENLTYDTCTVKEYCKKKKNEKKFDTIYHLASVVGPAGILKYAGEIIRSIVDDTYALIELAIENNAKLVDISTSEVYGGGKDGYCLETDSKIVPAETSIRLEYAVGKLAGETALINKTKVTELDASIIRPFNVAGPRQSGKGGFVLPRFIAMAIYNKPLTVFCEGDQIRAFTHVKDMVDGIIKTAQSGRNGEAYNLGNPNNKISILEMAERVVTLTKTKSEIIFVDPKTIYGDYYEEANDKYPDADRSIKELGWKPTRDIDKVILDTFNYMKNKNKVDLDYLSGGI